MRDIILKCQQPELSSHAHFSFVRYHSSPLETAEHGITALGTPSTLYVDSLPFLVRVSSQSQGNHSSNLILTRHVENATPQWHLTHTYIWWSGCKSEPLSVISATTQECASELPFQPKYRLAHPENSLFSLSKKLFSGLKYPKQHFI